MLDAFTLFHVVLSLVGIGSGLVVLYGLLSAKSLDGWTKIFLITTIATSVTGFLFPFHQFLPSHGVGILSLLILTVAVLARYRFRLEGGWRRAYSVTSVIALYFNVFVLIVQLFMKVPFLNALAPTQTETPFKIAQAIALLVFVTAGSLAVKRFRAEPPRAYRQSA
jgi:hypothetical protein